MAAMPGMEEEDGGKPKKKGPVDLAIIMGGKPGGKPMMSKDDGGDSGGSDELPHGFEEAAAEAFPDIAGDTERMQALKRLIMLCDNDESY